MIADALSRTILLARTELQPAATDEVIIDALQSTTVALVADEFALATHAGQSAFITAALQIARSGHRISLSAPNVPLVGKQPPLVGARLIDALTDIGADLLPEAEIVLSSSSEPVEIAILFGRSEWEGRALRTFAVSWTDWSASLSGVADRPKYEATDWPIGALAAGSLAAGEVFKAAMRKLGAFARNRDLFDELFSETNEATVELAPPASVKTSNLGTFDLVSGGAVANAVAYTLIRLPQVSGSVRVIDDDKSALSNLNRNMMLRRSLLDRFKVSDLATWGSGLVIEPLVGRYGEGELESLALRSNVLMGVDDIPSRWHAQAAWPEWLAVGATDRFSVQVSFHERGLPCAGCLHPTNAPIGGAIPTVAFVSFWSGLMLSVLYLKQLTGALTPAAQQTYFSPLRPSSFWSIGVSPDPQCPVECDASRKAA